MPPRRAQPPRRRRGTSASGSRAAPIGRDGRRAQLIAAAREIFSKNGYHDSTVDDITRAAGVAKGTFYLYFDEKRAVYHELVRSFLELIKDIGVSVSTEVNTVGEFYARTQQAAMRLVQVFVEHHALARLTYRESMGLDPELERMLGTFYRDLARVEAANIRRGIELGVFREVDPLVCAYAHIGMVERVALGLLREVSPPSPDHVVRELLSIALWGVRKR